jgi:hypothetical protein
MRFSTAIHTFFQFASYEAKLYRTLGIRLGCVFGPEQPTVRRSTRPTMALSVRGSAGKGSVFDGEGRDRSSRIRTDFDTNATAPEIDAFRVFSNLFHQRGCR